MPKDSQAQEKPVTSAEEIPKVEAGQEIGEEVEIEQEKDEFALQMENLNKQIKEMEDKYLRLAAEYENFRKRSAKEKDAIYPDAIATAALTFLPVADNFERALSMECSDAEYKKGVEMIYTSLVEGFTKLKVEAFGAVGDVFDPNLHTAIMHVEDEEQETQAIVEVFQKGYRYADKIIRFAVVKVAN